MHHPFFVTRYCYPVYLRTARNVLTLARLAFAPRPRPNTDPMRALGAIACIRGFSTDRRLAMQGMATAVREMLKDAIFVQGGEGGDARRCEGSCLDLVSTGILYKDSEHAYGELILHRRFFTAGITDMLDDSPSCQLLRHNGKKIPI